MKAQSEIDHDARLALENLTPGGSEFHNDPERCSAYIQQIKHSYVEAMKENVRLRRELGLDKKGTP
jgi:hypothetical protein